MFVIVLCEPKLNYNEYIWYFDISVNCNWVDTRWQ